jgi:hypothetical protein
MYQKFQVAIVQAATMEKTGFSPSLITAELLPSSKLPTNNVRNNGTHLN